MDKQCYTDVLNVSYTTNEELFKKQKKIIENVNNISAGYDDFVKKQKPEPQPDLPVANSDTNRLSFGVSHHRKTLRSFNKCCLLKFLVALALIAGTLLFAFCYELNEAQGTLSTEKYPTLNFNLCDPVVPFIESSWFTPILDSIPCDVPVKITEINVHVMILREEKNFNCLSKLDCMSLFTTYVLGNNQKHSFFVDVNSNVYQVRGWLCPHVSGQLWVGLVVDSVNVNALKEIKHILRHFEEEVTGYAEKCDFFSENVFRNYLNASYVYSDGLR